MGHTSGVSTDVTITECQLYQRGRCHYGDQCKYLHIIRQDSSARAPDFTSISYSTVHNSIPSQPVSAEADMSVLQDGISRETMAVLHVATAYPVRAGAPDCQYYLKTGKCNYGTRCKFNHPHRDESLVNALNRRDCFDFVQTGACPYGRNCKYNHPTNCQDALEEVEVHSASSSESSSSPRSVSRVIPKRSSSEPRYSTKTAISEESRTTFFAKARDISSVPVNPQLHATSVQPPSKWETSPNSSVTLAKRIANDVRRQRILKSGNLSQTQQLLSHIAKSGWTQSSESMTQLRPLSQISSATLPTAPPTLPLRSVDSYPYTRASTSRQLAPQACVIPNDRARAPQQMKPTSSIENALREPSETINGLQPWQNNPDHPNLIVRPRDVSPAVPYSSGIEMTHITETSRAQVQLPQRSIWGNDFATESAPQSIALPRNFFDSPQLGGSSVPMSQGMPHIPRMKQMGENQDTRPPEWTGDGSCQVPMGSYMAIGASLPRHDSSEGRDIGDESSSSKFVRAGVAGVAPLTTTWDMQQGLISRDGSSHEMQLQHQRHQLQLQQRQKQNQLQHLQRYERQRQQQPGQQHLRHGQQQLMPQRDTYVPMNGPQSAQIELQTYSEHRYGHRPDHSQIASGESTAIKQRNAQNYEIGQARPRLFDPMGYTSSFFGDEHIEKKNGDTEVNVWKPAESSSMFGPGLYGMQHREF